MPKIINDKYIIKNIYNKRKIYDLKISDIKILCNVSERTIYYIAKDDTITKNNRKTKIKRTKKIDMLSNEKIKFIIDNTINNALFSMKKLRKKYKKTFNEHISMNLVYSIYKKNKITYKRANTRSINKKSDRNKNDIKELHQKIVKINNNNEDDNILFTDEVHIDINEINNYGWNYKNQEVDHSVIKIKKNKKNKNTRLTLIASVSKKGKLDYTLAYGNVNGKIYKQHIKRMQRKKKYKYHYHDNCGIHRSKIVRNSMKRLGITVIRAISYTPELNIIEYMFNVLKKKIKKGGYEEKKNIRRFIRKCWNEIPNIYLEKTYDRIFKNNNFVDDAMQFTNTCI